MFADIPTGDDGKFSGDIFMLLSAVEGVQISKPLGLRFLPEKFFPVVEFHV